MEDVLFRGNREPTLDQILADPIVQTIMRRDGVDEMSVRRLMQHARLVFQPPKHQWTTSARGDDPADDPNHPPPNPGVIARPTAWPRVFPSL